jgi:hypothetical protein
MGPALICPAGGHRQIPHSDDLRYPVADVRMANAYPPCLTVRRLSCRHHVPAGIDAEVPGTGATENLNPSVYRPAPYQPRRI